MSNKKTLQVGDVVYRVSNYGPKEKLTISRTTEKMAFIGHKKFKIETNENGWLSEVGGDKWSIYSYKIETAELKATFERKELINAFDTAVNASGTSEKVKALSNDQIRLMLNILNDTENGK